MVKNLTGKMVIAEGALFDGKIKKADEIEVYGCLKGTVSADKVEIGADGSCIGNIRANTASLSGTYDGNLVSAEVVIKGSAQVNGTIKYHSLQMDRGAELNCRLTKMKKGLSDEPEASEASD
jgi:cytoskeletal protein CcmA (bactofilin family)